jgi:hypothetical protein
MPEAKESAIDLDAKVEELYGEGESSTSKKEPEPEGTETPSEKGEGKPEGEGEEQSQEDKAILEKLTKISEILGDDEKAIDAYIKEKGFHEHPAWKRQRELLDKYKQQGAVSDEDKNVIESVKKLTSSPEGIRLLMKHDGYTDEAINKRLRELGHDVPASKEDDFSFILKQLGVDVSQLTDEQKDYVNTYVADVVKIAGMLIDRKLETAFPEKLKPFQENLKTLTRDRAAAKYSAEMEDIVSKEGVLDFEKDIAPKIEEYIDSNPETSQEDVMKYFVELNHDLVIERLKTEKRKEVRDEEKNKNLRPQRKSTPTNVDLGKIKPVSGSNLNEVSKDIDRVMDELGFE